ncbi:hypothetical protein [Streptomyces sp. NPDC095613]|uniref:hypothetical protein n=1 Tax=Streptomyces sp. NPDC095613 TaxID=3155540 RepID=UPI0033337D7B
MAVCILLSMMSPAATRIHIVITFVLVTTGAVGGASLGLLLGGRLLAVVTAGAAGLGAGIASFLVRREVFALLRPDHRVPAIDGYAQGIADAVLAHIATYQASVFPLTPGGVTGREREARRTLAYRIAAYDGLPTPVRVSAAEALEAIDHGLDAKRAEAAMKALTLMVYDHRSGR